MNSLKSRIMFLFIFQFAARSVDWKLGLFLQKLREPPLPHVSRGQEITYINFPSLLGGKKSENNRRGESRS